jgi:2-deoxy-D-gluconate 3-dehydrogenase
VKLFDLKGRVALVTGGNGGIGLGMAKGMAMAGASIMVAGRDAKKSKSAVAELAALGIAADATSVDVLDTASCNAMVAATISRFGRLDILVNNAGTNFRKLPQDLTDADWHRLIDTNLTSAFVCSRGAYPHLKKSGHGKIINIGSMMSIFGAPWAGPYAASKGGVVQLSRALGAAWAPDNIQVNAILPGWVDTELTKGARRDIEGLHQRVVARTPAGRWGDPDDLAGIAVFLASSASDFITGTAIPVDGGYSSAII